MLTDVPCSLLKVGDVYVIADCGGGTVVGFLFFIRKETFLLRNIMQDLISYKVTAVEPRLRVKECVGGTGGLCGSTALNSRFKELVKERIGDMYVCPI